MRDFSKTHQSSLTLKGGSTSHLGLLPSGKKRETAPPRRSAIEEDRQSVSKAREAWQNATGKE